MPDWILPTLAADERRALVRPEAALQVDEHLYAMSRGEGCLDLCLGAHLQHLRDRAGYVELGIPTFRDYVRERTGLGLRHAQQLMKLHRDVRALPAIRQAVMSGDLSISKAQLIAPVASEETEEQWLAVAKDCTVRQLRERVKRFVKESEDQDGGGSDAASTEAAQVEVLEGEVTISLRVSEVVRRRFNEAIELAGRVCGVSGPRARLAQHILEEFAAGLMGELEPSNPLVDELGESAGVGRVYVCDSSADRLSCGQPWQQGPSLREVMEEESGGWPFLPQIQDKVVAPEWATEVPADVDAVDDNIERLIRLRRRRSWTLGRLGRLMQGLGLWRPMLFSSFGHYVSERLGISLRGLQAHIALDRACDEVPLVRDAYVAGELGYEQTRLIARVAIESTQQQWLAVARRTTCDRLRREVELALEQESWSPVTLCWLRSLEHDGQGIGQESGSVVGGEPEVKMSSPLAELGVELSEAMGWQRWLLTSAKGCLARWLGPEAPVDRWVEWFCLFLPESAEGLWTFCLKACRELGGPQVSEGAVLRAAADHFIAMWAEAFPSPENPVLEQMLKRDGYRCANPLCTCRRGLNWHHIVFRSHGGAVEELSNVITLCSTCHLEGVHGGRIRIRGTALDGLVFEIGTRGEEPPLYVYRWVRNPLQPDGHEAIRVGGRALGY